MPVAIQLDAMVNVAIMSLDFNFFNAPADWWFASLSIFYPLPYLPKLQVRTLFDGFLNVWFLSYALDFDALKDFFVSFSFFTFWYSGHRKGMVVI